MHFSLTTECAFIPPGMQSYLLGQAFRNETPPAVILATGVVHGIQILSHEVSLTSFFFVKTFPGGGGVVRL